MTHTLDPAHAELNELPRLLTPAEAAAAIRRSPRTIRRWLSTGLIRAVRVAGGNPLIERSELQRLLREGGAR